MYLHSLTRLLGQTNDAGRVCPLPGHGRENANRTIPLALILLFAVIVLGLGVAHWRYRQSPWYLQERAILGALNEPATAELRRVRQSMRDPAVYCGEVNPGESSGVMAGFSRYLVRVAPGIPAERYADPDYLAQLRRSHALYIEPATNEVASDAEAFQRAWAQYCVIDAQSAS